MIQDEVDRGRVTAPASYPLETIMPVLTRARAIVDTPAAY